MRSLLIVLKGLIMIPLLASLHYCTPVNNDPDPNDDKDSISNNQTETYLNPIYVPSADEIADPSVYRYKNRFYLLSTQLYSRYGAGMTVWSSANLVEWDVHAKVPIIGEVEPILAPELVYHEGSYYLYWSVYPGEVHYAAKYSPDPEDFDPFGPSAIYEVFSYDFLEVDDMIDIDGEIFFDGNDLYMFYCGFGGIHYKQLESLEESGVSLPVQLTDCAVNNINILPGEVGTNGWTEAPGIFFEDGYYYLTYSGVHYLRYDYQIHSARGETISSISPYKANPLIAKFDGNKNGMGNNNFTLGPNLVDKYLTYHVKIGAGIHDPSSQIDRRLMIDRYEVSSEDGILTDAPTLEDMPIPGAIGWVNALDSIPSDMHLTGSTTASMEMLSNSIQLSTDETGYAELLTDTITAGSFAIEGNIKGFSGTNGNSSKYGISACDGKVRYAIVMGESPTSYASLQYYLEGVGWTDTGLMHIKYPAWHKLRIDKNMDTIKFYYDDRFVCQSSVTGLAGGKTGYFIENCQAAASWIGFSDY